MNTDEQKLWMEVYIASVRTGKYDANQRANDAVRAYRMANIDLSY